MRARERCVVEVKRDKYYDFNGDCETQVFFSKNRSKRSSSIKSHPRISIEVKDFSAVYRNKKHYHNKHNVIQQLHELGILFEFMKNRIDSVSFEDYIEYMKDHVYKGEIDMSKHNSKSTTLPVVMTGLTTKGTARVVALINAFDLPRDLTKILNEDTLKESLIHLLYLAYEKTDTHRDAYNKKTAAIVLSKYARTLLASVKHHQDLHDVDIADYSFLPVGYEETEDEREWFFKGAALASTVRFDQQTRDRIITFLKLYKVYYNIEKCRI